MRPPIDDAASTQATPHRLCHSEREVGDRDSNASAKGAVEENFSSLEAKKGVCPLYFALFEREIAFCNKPSTALPATYNTNKVPKTEPTA